MLLKLPPWFEQGHLRDDVARELDSQSPMATFLSAGNQPQKGMHGETSIRTKQGKWFRLSGMVTFVGDPPAAEEVAKSDSLFMGLANAEHANTKNLSAHDKRAFILQVLGSINGQKLKTISRLTKPHAGEAAIPIQNHDVVEVTYRFNDSMFYPWVVEELRMLRQDEIDDLPPYFYQVSFYVCVFPRMYTSPTAPCFPKTSTLKAADVRVASLARKRRRRLPLRVPLASGTFFGGMCVSFLRLLLFLLFLLLLHLYGEKACGHREDG